VPLSQKPSRSWGVSLGSNCRSMSFCERGTQPLAYTQYWHG
jgi:hypothetical protein